MATCCVASHFLDPDTFDTARRLTMSADATTTDPTDASAPPTSPPRAPRATPKDVAVGNLDHVQKQLGKLRDRVEGWGNEKLNIALASAIDNLAVAEKILPDVEVPTGPETYIGREFRVKKSALRFYEGLVLSEEQVFTVKSVAAGRHLISETGDIRLSLPRNHVEWVEADG